jgi:3-methyladenine DNA glycosylase/8-oxoguanine DNA glycosylase
MLQSRDRDSITRVVRSCLRLDEDFLPFHREARRHAEFRWIARSGAGRLLRAPTVFEDAVKMICTTNCTWALTKVMVERMVREYGIQHDDTHYAFPEPGALAAITEKALRAKCSTGYRAPAILELARRVASGTLDIESLRTSSLPTGELFEELLSIRGIGPYAAGNMMKLLGRYDYLGLDSWVRKRFYELHTRGRKVKDSTIERHYATFGTWRGLFFWLEMTKDWH